jgi:hypothetical protein
LGHDAKAPLFFGEQLISAYGQRYMAGGGGYVLSRETLDQFVRLLKDKRTDKEVDPSICALVLLIIPRQLILIIHCSVLLEHFEDQGNRF